MRSIIALLSLLFVPSAVPVVANAQNLSPEMIEAGKRVDEAFDQNLKGWTRERGVPIQGSSNVIIESWKTYDRWVKVSIGIRSVEAENIARSLPTFKKIEGIGDDAVIWGYFGNIHFRHGRVGVSVSSEVDLNLFSRDKDENWEMSRTEAAATSRLMACFINLALGGDLTKGKPIPRQGFLQRPCEQELLFKRLLGDYIVNQIMSRY